MRKEFEYLNLARFVGAFWVLLFHANIHFGSLSYLSLVNPLIDQGVLGMTLFFVLSGFVLSYRYVHFEHNGSMRDFYAARVMRLYPVYIFMAIVTLPTLVASGAEFTVYEKLPVLWFAVMIFLAVFALQAWVPAVFPVWNFGGSWSLSVEAFFYSLFPILRPGIARLTSGSILRLIASCVVVMALILLMLMSQLGDRSQAISYYVLPIFRLPEFILGMAIFILCVERREFVEALSRISVWMLGAMLILVYLVDIPGNIDFGFLFALPAAMAFVKSLDMRANERLAALFNYLGHISYCLYLVQFGTVPYFKSSLDGMSSTYAWFAFTLVTFLLANILYFFVEVPGRSRLKRLYDQRFASQSS